MYTLSIPDAVLSTRTLAGLFNLFRDERVRVTDTALIELRGAPADVSVTRYNGELALRQSGSAESIVTTMLEEVRSAGFLDDEGAQRESWQIRAADWDGLFEFVDVCRKPQLLLSTNQVEAATSQARERGRRFELCELCIETMTRLFSFGYCGPAIPGTRDVNSRHEVQVAYALLANLPVPEAVLDDYRQNAGAFRYGPYWAQTLIRVPELRGAMPGAKLEPVVSVMKHNGKTIDAQNADILTMVARLLPDRPSHPEVEDVLHANGLIDDLPLPATFDQPVDVGEPVSPLAKRVRELVADTVRKRAIDYADRELAAGNISRRLHRHRCNIARLEHGRHTFAYGNRLSRALDERNVGLLLDVLDTSDEHNRSSKMAFHEVLGAKVLGLRSAARRRAVFHLCGFNEDEQAQWERDAAQAKAERDAERDLKEAREVAARARYIGPGQGELTGVEHVDRAISEGYCTIQSFRHGATLRYALVRGNESAARRPSAKDGTLAYARAVLDRRAA
ncbi:hypothetical protein VSR34_29850 [Paraburkholderia sp. JHI2823]|uniref:hypothetical protein n=1 Tax=Paraburkholderia sp. JHI2823 TaxID=3112960 RepID=UPI003181319A